MNGLKIMKIILRAKQLFDLFSSQVSFDALDEYICAIIGHVRSGGEINEAMNATIDSYPSPIFSFLEKNKKDLYELCDKIEMQLMQHVERLFVVPIDTKEQHAVFKPYMQTATGFQAHTQDGSVILTMNIVVMTLTFLQELVIEDPEQIVVEIEI